MMSAVPPRGVSSAGVLRMFPTFVWRGHLDDERARQISDGVLAEIRAEWGREAASAARGEGWQSRHSLHERPSLQPLIESVHEAAARLLEFDKIAHRQIVMTGCWINVLGPGAAHRMHAHPNNYLSGVYYVQVQEGASTINFHDPRPQTAIIRPPVTELTADNADQVVVRVDAGDLLLFPAWLSHSVDANASELPRISVSFNLMLEGLVEVISKPMWGDE